MCPGVPVPERRVVCREITAGLAPGDPDGNPIARLGGGGIVTEFVGRGVGVDVRILVGIAVGVLVGVAVGVLVGVGVEVGGGRVESYTNCTGAASPQFP